MSTEGTRSRIRRLMANAGLTSYQLAREVDREELASFHTVYRFLLGKIDTTTKKADAIEQYIHNRNH